VRRRSTSWPIQAPQGSLLQRTCGHQPATIAGRVSCFSGWLNATEGCDETRHSVLQGGYSTTLSCVPCRPGWSVHLQLSLAGCRLQECRRFVSLDAGVATTDMCRPPPSLWPSAIVRAHTQHARAGCCATLCARQVSRPNTALRTSYTFGTWNKHSVCETIDTNTRSHQRYTPMH
jgi:hypothetical protein